MDQNTEFSFSNIYELTRDEKREIWMKRTGHSVAYLASLLGISANVLSRYLRASDMPAVHHAALVAYGVPDEVLPDPVQRTLGRRPIVPRQQTESSQR